MSTYLLDVNPGPGKHIYELGVLSALLVTMPETEISVVAPSVYFSWVCEEEDNKKT